MIVLDPARTRTLSAATQRQNTDFSVWEGMQVQGVVVHTFSRGAHLWADGELRAEAGRGRYLARQPFGHAYQGARLSGGGRFNPTGVAGLDETIVL